MKEFSRVRYVKSEEGKILTSAAMLGKEHVITVVINTLNMEFKLLAKNGEVLLTRADKTVAGLKKQAKAALVSSGVLFVDEVRNVKEKIQEEM